MRGLANTISHAGLALGVLALAGCATTGSVKRAQGAADSAMTAAQKAQSSADAAEGDAQAANAAAMKAQGGIDGNTTAIGQANARIDTLEHKVGYLMRHRHAAKHKKMKAGHHHWHDGKKC